jgi:BASS family bile acid:Na+ symporter
VKRFVDAFSLWIVLSTALALAYPPSFTWFDLAWINPLLSVIMLGMGLTLTWDDFARVGSAPKPILLGVLLQFTIMPLAGYGIGLVFGLEPALAAGLILVSCCPGGTASNVIAYIARADVAMSVSMTLLSTLAAVVMTPFLTSMLVGQSVAVDALILLEGTL